MNNSSRASSLRIIGSAIYDGLVILGLLMIAGFIAVFCNKLITGEESINADSAINYVEMLDTSFSHLDYLN